MREIRKANSKVIFIVMTAYDKFDYAKEAISLGVAHYLTKPISGDELIKELNALSERIEDKKRERMLHEKYIRDMEENYFEERKKLFQYMVTGGKSVPELLDQAGKLDMDISALCYNIVLYKISSTKHSEEEYSGSVVEVEDRIKNSLNPKHALLFDRSMEGKAIVYKADSLEELLAIQTESIDTIKEILSNYSTINYFGGVGQAVNRLGELSHSFEAASHAFAHRYLLDENTFMFFDSADKKIQSGNENFNLSNINPHEVDRKKVAEFLRRGEREEIVYFIEEYFNNLGEQATNSNLFRQYIAMDTYFAVVAFVEELGQVRSENNQFAIVGGDLDDVPSTVNYLAGIMDKALEFRDGNVKKKFSKQFFILFLIGLIAISCVSLLYLI